MPRTRPLTDDDGEMLWFACFFCGHEQTEDCGPHCKRCDGDMHVENSDFIWEEGDDAVCSG